MQVTISCLGNILGISQQEGKEVFENRGNRIYEGLSINLVGSKDGKKCCLA